VSERLGQPRLHLRRTGSTNVRGRALAAAGAPHGTLVTAAEQTAGRGRLGRGWFAPPGRSLLMSLVLRLEDASVVSLAAGVAVAEAIGAQARLKWPNDVMVDGRKVAGILVEGRPQEGWAVLGIGVNVAVDPGDFPADLRHSAGVLGLEPVEIERLLDRILVALERWLAAGPVEVRSAWAARPA
jgi:BirA family biotin operon repressor/biotin-[acetyl-CoA-carboxylase] ligase